MKFIFILLASALLSVISCKGQQKQENVNTADSCLSQKNKQKIYAGLKERILRKGGTETRYGNDTVTNFRYNDLTLTHRFVPNNSKKDFPDFNMETIDVVGKKIYYQLVCGGHYDEQDVAIHIKDYPEEKAKMIQRQSEQHFCEVLSKINFSMTKEDLEKIRAK